MSKIANVHKLLDIWGYTGTTRNYNILLMQLSPHLVGNTCENIHDKYSKKKFHSTLEELYCCIQVPILKATPT